MAMHQRTKSMWYRWLMLADKTQSRTRRRIGWRLKCSTQLRHNKTSLDQVKPRNKASCQAKSPKTRMPSSLAKSGWLRKCVSFKKIRAHWVKDHPFRKKRIVTLSLRGALTSRCNSSMEETQRCWIHTRFSTSGEERTITQSCAMVKASRIRTR